MQIYFKRKKTGGISFNSTAPLTHIDEKLCYQILHEYKIHNAEVRTGGLSSSHGRSYSKLCLPERSSQMLVDFHMRKSR